MIRRSFLSLLPVAAMSAPPPRIRLSIGTYGMQMLAVDRALDLIRKTGYDGAELCLMPGWPSEPAKLDTAARRRIGALHFPIPTLIENFNLLVSDEAHRATLDRIRAAAALAHDISPQSPPILQTVLGGKPEEWRTVNKRMAARLAEWARVAEDNHIQIAVKSHFGSAANDVGRLLHLIGQVSSPALGGIYDYSHFQLMDIDLRESLLQLLPHSLFITVKDGRLVDGKPQFLLPGEGTIDYDTYFRILRERNYSGWMLVEISRQLQTKPGYDPVHAAQQSYRFLSAKLRVAGLRP
ncbi:MAG: sugar phosphate isomerase/epimerase [Acidobacteria bacterium]|nr:sugar phosphate isomerase/epimerase [Acidobacteriota bacterium]